MSKILASFLFLTACCNAATVLYPGPESINNYEWTFPGFTADTLVGVFDPDVAPPGPPPAHALVHDHAAGPTTFGLDLLLNGAWINVASFTTTGFKVEGVFMPYPIPSDPPYPLFAISFIDYPIETAFPGPVSFAPGVVSGIRLTSDRDLNFGYHFLENTSFVFADSSAVPEPNTLSLMGLGLACLLLGDRRLRGTIVPAHALSRRRLRDQ